MSSGMMPPWLISAAAVAYEEKALANSRMRLPKNAGASTGTPTRRQYVTARAAEGRDGLAPLRLQRLHGGHEREHHERDPK